MQQVLGVLARRVRANKTLPVLLAFLLVTLAGIPWWAETTPGAWAALATPVGILFIAVIAASAAAIGWLVAVRSGPHAELLRRVNYDHLFDNPTEAVVLVDSNGLITRASEQFQLLFGYSPREAEGRSILDLIVPVPLHAEARAHLRAVMAASSVRADVRRRHKDGGLVDVSLAGVRLHAPDGRQTAALFYRSLDSDNMADEVLSLRKAVETMQLGVTITSTNGKVLYTNEAEARMHGMAVDEMVGKDASSFAPSGKRRRPMSKKQLDELNSWQRESTNQRRDGTVFPVKLFSDAVRNTDGDVIGVVTTCEDITERRQAEDRLRESEERYALAARGANDVLWDWNLLTNTLYLSPRWSDLVLCTNGRRSDGPDEWLGRVQADDMEDLKVQIAVHLQGIAPHLEHEHRLTREDGTHRWVLCRGTAVRDDTGKATRVAGSMTDITERKSIEERLHHDAFHDGLTELPNRAFFAKMLKRAIGRAGRDSAQGYAVLFVDIDRLKFVNDSMGHNCGDQLIALTARRLEACVRPGDTVARLGGDEFTVLLDDVSGSDEALAVAGRILQNLQEPCRLGGREIVSSASIGVALGSPDYDRAEEVIRDADLAMYRAKRQGKARYELFDKAMHENAISALQLETDLRQAIDGKQLEIFYQPIVSLSTEKISGFEALVRWQHPQRGTVYPLEFISLAEETGLIIPMGRWILKEACRQLYDWQQRFPSDPLLTVSVNMSPKQFEDKDMVSDIMATLQSSGLKADSLRIEITEGTALEHGERTATVIRKLAEAGVHVQIDDFGTGYSALSHLQNFNFDTLKIDRTFVSQLSHSRENVEIVRTIMSMARTLGMNVIAEGVETDDQRQQLRELDCEEGQGYLFSEALDSAGVEELLAAGQ